MSYKYTIPEGWAESELQEFCVKVADGTHDSPKRTEHGKLLVTSKNIIGGTLDLSKSYCISEDDFNEINRRSKVDINDVLLSMIGTVGEACLIDSEPDFAIKNVGLLKNDDPLKAQWLYFYLTSPQAQIQIKERLRGTTQQYLPLGEIRRFPIIYPRSRTEMQEVVEALAVLQNKIQLNHQINQTLEQMAQAIFKSWFVDFEPVKAKIAALEAGGSEEDALLAAMQAISGTGEAELTRLQAEQPEQYAELRATAELFPSAMQDSELGEIPEGWGVPSFEDITVAKQGKYLAKDKMSPTISPDSNVPVWGGNGVLGYTKSCSYPAPVVLMTCRGSNCGLIRHTESEAWVSNNAFACSPRIGSVWFLLTYFNASSFDDCISGSAQPQITYSALRSKKLAIPIHEETCKRYSALIQAMFDQIIHLRNEALSLENLRDALLPKLLTGELSVSATEDQLAEPANV